MKKRGLVISLLVLLAVITSGFTYAFWAAGVTGDSDVAAGSITIGQGQAVTTTVTIDDAGLISEALVPTAYAPTPGGAEGEDYVLLSFLVTWAGNGATGAVSTVSLTDTVYSGLGTLDDAAIDLMFDATIVSGASVTAGTPSNVVVKVIFASEPASQAIYDEVALGTLVVTLTFAVADIPA